MRNKHKTEMQNIRRCYHPDIIKNEHNPKYIKLEKGHFIMLKAIFTKKIKQKYLCVK